VYVHMPGTERLEDLNSNFKAFAPRRRERQGGGGRVEGGGAGGLSGGGIKAGSGSGGGNAGSGVGVEGVGSGVHENSGVRDGEWYARVDARLRRFGYSLRHGYSAETARGSVLALWELR
jgi:hypothetical protein